LRHSFQNRREIVRRTGNDSENLARRRLLLQSLGQFAIACLLLVNEPCILDGNHRLVGEGLEKANLVVSEGLDPQPAKVKYPENYAISQQRDS
jgi:hypothetical protein